MIEYKRLKIKLFITLLFILNIYCNQLDINNVDQKNYNVTKLKEININNMNITITNGKSVNSGPYNCPGNQYITSINGCALENSNEIRICDINNHNRCIKRKGSGYDVEITTDPNQYNRFKFDYTGNDKFEIYNQGSNIFISLYHTDSFQWRRTFETKIYDSNNGILDIFSTGCYGAGSTVYCQDRSMCPYFDGVHGIWGHKQCWVSIIY